MIFASPPAPLDPLRAAIAAAYLADEGACVDGLLREATLEESVRERIHHRAGHRGSPAAAPGEQSGRLSSRI